MFAITNKIKFDKPENRNDAHCSVSAIVKLCMGFDSFGGSKDLFIEAA